MNPFPIILNIRDKKFLVIGGGKVATEKIKRLLIFTKNITILSPDLTSELKEIVDKEHLTYISQKYAPELISDYDIIIVAVNDIKLQKEIYQYAKKITSYVTL
ncbi:bifunctional precorrin-2 dehydrogenase/sirohydrochlorin ferrochelatase [Sulfurihydrogenibium azorense]|uniref:precorrin-2 dehydrogenase/sirohydrochlorin ferrochelatase family protein n=1 Tax=Sulfurihydrogenibium azorense TaxID=309806 RepID=UPI00391DB164